MKTGQASQRDCLRLRLGDYTHFVRGFRRRFDTVPGAVGAGATGGDNARVRANFGQIKRSSTK
jgi:AraC family transcriptional regulator, positive regulator of tynA and feaB